MFKNLCKLVYNALTIPNSNAPPERICSSYNFIKNQWRASFKSYTVKCMIQAKEYIKSVGGAENFVANEDIFELFNSDIYAAENSDNMSEGDIFLERERYNLNEEYLLKCKEFDNLFKNKESGIKRKEEELYSSDGSEDQQ